MRDIGADKDVGFEGQGTNTAAVGSWNRWRAGEVDFEYGKGIEFADTVGEAHVVDGWFVARNNRL